MQVRKCNYCGGPMGSRDIVARDSVTGIDTIASEPYCNSCRRAPRKSR